MLEIEKELPKTRPSARDFLLAAREDPNRPIEKTIRGCGNDTFKIRNILVTLNCVFGDETLDSYREMAGGVSHSRVGQIVKKTLKAIWRESPPDLQSQYPLQEIRLRVNDTLETVIKKSKARSGAFATMLGLVDQEDPNRKMKEKGYSATQICSARNAVRKWGYEIPSVNFIRADEDRLTRNLKETRDDTKVQELLSSVRLNFYEVNRHGENSLLATLKEAVADYHVPPRSFTAFAAALKENKIPFRMIRRYYFLLRRDLERAREAFLSDSTLEKFRENPVTQTCGPKADKLPSTTAIQRSGNYKHPSPLLRELGIGVKGRGARYKLAQFLTDDCPIPVFRYRGQNYYPSVYQDQLKEFFKTRINTIK